jgi:hypothetical protein
MTLRCCLRAQIVGGTVKNPRWRFRPTQSTWLLLPPYRYIWEANTWPPRGVKNLSVTSLLQISEAVGIRGIFVTDEKLLRKYRPLYENRNERKIHARQRAKLGAATMRRVTPVVLSEIGKRGAAARNAKLTPEVRAELARAAAQCRWNRKRP